MFARISAILLAALLLTGCAHKTENKTRGEEISPLVAYCRSIDYADTASLRSDEVMTQIVSLMMSADSLTIQTALPSFFKRINNHTEAIYKIDSIAAHYLSNPASSVRNEELYIQFLQSMLSVDSIPEGARLRAEENLRIASLNRRGTIANDIRFLTREGKEDTLSSHNDSIILLVFYDPECPHCRDILNMVAKSPQINKAIDRGDINVIAIYAEGKRDVWEDTKKDLPENWEVGYDLSKILDNELYDLPAMPIFYLLSPDKHVILKDPDVTTLLSLFAGK